MAIIIDKEEGREAEPCDNCESPDNDVSYSVEVGNFNFNLCVQCLRDLGHTVDNELGAA